VATLILKATEACNSHCAYCDVVHKARTGPTTMTREVLERVFIRIDELLRESPEEELEVVWHGGEPLLPGPDFYAYVVELQERHCAGTRARVTHSVQTNLSLFTREFARIFRQLGMDCIGTSYDPIAGVRGPGDRPDTAAYNAKFMHGLQIAEEEGFGWGVIYVVTKLALERPLEVFHFMTNLKLDGGINFHPVLVYGPEPRHLAITPEEFADFLGAIFPEWWRHQDRYPQVEPFRSLVRNVREGAFSLGCGDSGRCSDSHWNVAPDGAVSHCGRSADWGLLDYGTVFDTSFAEMLRDPQRRALVERNEVLPAGECRDCRLWAICHGGCPLDSWAVHRSFAHRTPWCEAKRRFVERTFEPVTGLRCEWDAEGFVVAP
jgi:radical SAM protein with 4Fe4S-binding SPASM domain